MSTLEVNTINPQSGSTITLGSSGNTVALGSGVSGSGFGKIGQVIQGTLTSTATSTSTTAADTGLGVSITPSATSSKIYLSCNLGGCRMATNTYMSLWIYRQIGGGGYSSLQKIENGFGYINGSSWQTLTKSQFYLDSPNTSSQVDYKIYFAYNGSGANVKINVDAQEYSTITAMEVLA